MNKKLILGLALATALKAETLAITFDGYQSSFGLHATYNGTVTFADGLTAVGLGDVTDFTGVIYDEYAHEGSAQYLVSTKDLENFSATVGSDGVFQELSLYTATLDPMNIDSFFKVIATIGPDNFWGAIGNAQGYVDPYIVGEVAVPEPRAFEFFAIIVITVAFFWFLSRLVRK